MHRIACFGDNCVDYYDKTDEAYYGGNPVNVAVYTKRLGYDASYIGAVGTDIFGKNMINKLRKKGVDTSHISVINGNTALTHVEIKDNDRILGDYDEGVMADFKLSKSDLEFIKEHDLAVTGLWGKCEKELELLKDITLAFDSADRPYDNICNEAIENIDILFFSDDNSDLEKLKEVMIERKNRGPELVIATRGEKGSILYDGKDFIIQGIIKCDVVDTMGAGDSFIAGFLNAYLCKLSLSECMEQGAICSKDTLLYNGAW